MTSKPNWVCSICGQTFTTNTSGKRHNLNLHSGMSQIVNYTEYYVGRLNGKYLQPSNSPLSFRRKKSLEVNFLDVQDKQQQQQNNPYSFIPNISDVKNNIFYDFYNNTLTDLTESRDALSNNFFQENADMIAYVIEEYQEKMQPFLRKEDITWLILDFIVIPLFSLINPREKFFHNKRQLDNFFANIRISRGINA